MKLQVVIIFLSQLLCWPGSTAIAGSKGMIEETHNTTIITACTVPHFTESNTYARYPDLELAFYQTYPQDRSYLHNVPVNIFDDVSILPNVIIPLNSDIRRLRVVAGTRPILPIVLYVLPACLPFDATSFRKYASYHFSTTDFHKYLFRLKPF